MNIATKTEFLFAIEIENYVSSEDKALEFVYDKHKICNAYYLYEIIKEIQFMVSLFYIRSNLLGWSSGLLWVASKRWMHLEPGCGKVFRYFIDGFMRVTWPMSNEIIDENERIIKTIK